MSQHKFIILFFSMKFLAKPFTFFSTSIFTPQFFYKPFKTVCCTYNKANKQYVFPIYSEMNIIPLNTILCIDVASLKNIYMYCIKVKTMKLQ